MANRLCDEITGAWRPNQFANMANPEAHYAHTGPEIWEQTEGRLSAFVAGAGTGGTISGVGRYLKVRNPKIRVIGADIEGSVLSGGTPMPWKVEGIGEDFVPSTLNANVVDEWIRISDAESFAAARRVAREEGILLGGSSGTALSAAFLFAQRCSGEDLIVVLCPDTGRNYLTKMFDDSWMAQSGFTDVSPETVTVGDLLSALGREGKLICATPQDTVHKAAETLQDRSISQLPVVENGKMIGAVEELTIMHALHRGLRPEVVPVREIMARPLPQLEASVLLGEVYRMLLAGNPAVVVTRSGQLFGIVTRADLMAFYERVQKAPARGVSE